MKVLTMHVAGALAMLSIGLVAVASARYARAQAAHSDVTAKAIRIATDCAELQRLQSTAPTAYLGEPPEEMVVTSIRQTLRTAGLPPRSWNVIDTDGGQAERRRDSRSNVTTRTVRLDLKAITPAQLGAFLFEWSLAEPLWTPTSINMAADTRSPGLYNVQLALKARYVDQSLRQENING
ncbi:MAG: hypothetical protein AAGI53_11715 [Planctomycetota bacterium]